jgi:di/tripeptidase
VCSGEFTSELSKEFSKYGLDMKADKTGYYTDTGNFLELIPERTNISIGVWNEHHYTEYVDISYVEKWLKLLVK